MAGMAAKLRMSEADYLARYADSNRFEFTNGEATEKCGASTARRGTT